MCEIICIRCNKNIVEKKKVKLNQWSNLKMFH